MSNASLRLVVMRIGVESARSAYSAARVTAALQFYNKRDDAYTCLLLVSSRETIQKRQEVVLHQQLTSVRT
jgi:hypothetical protein